MTFQPIKVLKIELGTHLPTIMTENRDRGVQYGSAQLLIRLHHQPLGLVEIPAQGDMITADVYASVIWDALGATINAHLVQDGLPQLASLPLTGIPGGEMAACQRDVKRLLGDAPLISVVICTHERADLLSGCLESVFRLDYPHYEVIVVDNAPRTTQTCVVVENMMKRFPNLRYIVEPNQGQCWARNTGARASEGEIVAFTDDDVVVDEHWLIGVLQGFSSSDHVGAVNGLTVPAELETQEQSWFEQSGGFNKGYEKKVYDMDLHKPVRPFYPLSAGIFGTGANLSIKRTALEAVGYFDPALGAGTITTCGDDLAMYVQLLFAGYQLVYEPAAFLQHIHRRDYRSLKKQIYNYGVGFTAFLTKTMLDHPRVIPGFLLGIPYGLYLLLSPRSFKNKKKESSYPSDLKGLEYRGMLRGGFSYIQSKRRTKRLIRQREIELASTSQS